jgi:hypothetical protein
VTAPAATGRYAPGGLAARRFPLTPRPKPPCRPLGQRLDRAARLAAQAQTGGADTLLHAAGACNLAALIASDCAMPDLARDLCWQQFDAYTTAGPYSETIAKLALQPLVNLARLRIRDGDSHGGYQVFQSLHEAARSSGGQAAIDGRTVSITALIAQGSTRETVTEWLWAVLLTDGLRALCQDGRWADALSQAQQHDGIGSRLLGGRQIAVLALAADGRHEEAGRLLHKTNPAEPWEHAVTSCLWILLQAPGEAAPASACAEMTSAFLALNDPDHAMFMACLGLTAAELAVPDNGQPAVISEITRIAAQSRDAYIAREVLSSPVAPIVRKQSITQLHGIVRQSGLGRPLTQEQRQRLTTSARAATSALMAGLSSRHLASRGEDPYSETGSLSVRSASASWRRASRKHTNAAGRRTRGRISSLASNAGAVLARQVAGEMPG